MGLSKKYLITMLFSSIVIIYYTTLKKKEDDLELIEFVSTLVHRPPSARIINLNNKKKKDFSQIDQCKFIDSVLKSKLNGFFVEITAGSNGEDSSNTLFFELERNWTGLLIELEPSFHKLIQTKNRNVFSINCCISSTKNKKFPIYSPKFNYVPCFSLNTILKAINVNKIDYFSISNELDVLNGINFNQIDITTFSIRNNDNEKMKKFLESKNYDLIKDSGDGNAYFIKKDKI